MKSMTRLHLGLNRSLSLMKSINPLLCRRWFDINEKNFQFSRSESQMQRKFEGPSLKDFLVQEQTNKIYEAKNEYKEEIVPYIDKLDLNGNGQKVFFQVFGCQMNTNDTEIIWSILQKNGYQKTTEMINADIVLIITCAIRDSAEVKIWTLVNQIRSFKKIKNKDKMKIGVLGCMAERLKNKIIDLNKAVDLVAGPDSYKDLPRLLAVLKTGQKAVNVLLSLDETYADVLPVRLDENTKTAYVSIMRGCDNMCTYCIVPFTRGRERSRPIISILDEVRKLSDQGVKQITLLGQNVNSYRDMSADLENTEFTKLVKGFQTVYKTKKGGLRFDVLLDKVSEINPNMRIRFTAPHPKDFPDEVLHLIRDRKNICNNLHLPAQSGSSAVLERMRRGHTREAYLDLVDHIRSIVPNVSFTTDLITGFCGETEKDHQDTLDLLRRVRYSFVYHFPYSMREKTTAHRRYEDDVPKEVKIRRLREIEMVFLGICAEINKAQISQTQLILIERLGKKLNAFQGRNDANTIVIVPFCSVPVGINSTETKPIQLGDYVAVTITEANSKVLKGVPLYHTSLVDFDESLAAYNSLKKIEASV